MPRLRTNRSRNLIYALLALAVAAVVGSAWTIAGAQPPANHTHGAVTSGPYNATTTGGSAGNGNGNGKAVGKPCAGCVGNADNKNPPGQLPNGSDHNAGYECDRNHGVGRGNPAHTGCGSVTASTSESESKSASESESKSASESESASESTSHSESESGSVSVSASESGSTSESGSESESGSVSGSVSGSGSGSTSGIESGSSSQSLGVSGVAVGGNGGNGQAGGAAAQTSPGLLASTGIRIATLTLLSLATLVAGFTLVMLGRRARRAVHRR
ncbi:MAG TPA: hypothetical protein VKB75_02275 [Jatrophihabitans sp.]|nr:hypothetical protein [Jatrophihabitans sp.]